MRPLLAGLGALVVVQLLHALDGLRTGPDTVVTTLVDPLVVVGVGTCAGAAVLVAAGHRLGPSCAFAAAGGVALGFVLVHGLPVESSLTGPYWTVEDGSRADTLQWATVLVAVALGAWCAARAWRLRVA